MLRRTTKFLALVELYKISQAIYTEKGYVNLSGGIIKEKICDNNFDDNNFEITEADKFPYINIRLQAKSIIVAVMLFNRQDNF